MGIAQHPVLGPKPVEALFSVFVGEGAFEPGVQHAVREDDIG